VAMAAALKAKRCEIVKEVDGVCTADPRLVPDSKPLRRLDFASLSEMCFWGAKVLHFRCVEMAQSQNVTLIIKKWGMASEATLVTKEVEGMESGKVLSVNSIESVEHIEIDSTDLNQGFDRFSQHLRQNTLSWPQMLASAYDNGKTRIMLTSDTEALQTLLRTLDKSTGLRRIKDTLSSVSITCYGSVGSDLPNRALQILGSQNIKAEKYILSAHSVTVFIPPDTRAAAVKALHTLI